MDVDDAIADIALVFGWTVADCAPMRFWELLAWRQRAYERASVRG